MTNRVKNKSKICTFEGCNVYDNGGGLCAGHFRQRSLGQELRAILRTVEERFWSRVEKGGPEECWNWTGGHNGRGYGKFYVKREEPVYAHRWSYAQVNGPIPNGLVIDHICRNSRCVNPKHLQAVTQAVNLQNLGVRSNSKSGVRGVTWYASRGKWVANVGFNGETHFLGYYDDVQEAEKVVVAKRKELMVNSGD